MESGLVRVEVLGFPHSVGVVLELVLRRSMGRSSWHYSAQGEGHASLGTVRLIAANTNVSAVRSGLSGVLATLTVAEVTETEQLPYTIAADQLFNGLLEALDRIVARTLVGPTDASRSTLSADTDIWPHTSDGSVLAGEEKAAGPFPFVRPRVLLVDQSRAIRAQLSAVMADMEVSVLARADQQGAETALAQQHFDALIYDADLVSGSPTSFCRQLRRVLPEALPVLILTSQPSAIDRLWQSLAGCRRCLSKPIDLERFRFELQRLLPAFPQLAETDMQLLRSTAWLPSQVVNYR